MLISKGSGTAGLPGRPELHLEVQNRGTVELIHVYTTQHGNATQGSVEQLFTAVIMALSSTLSTPPW